MNKNNYAVIMAGGVGERFWPMSKVSRPKQFIDILGTGRTLIQQTYDRFLSVCERENIYIVTNKIYRDLVISQLEGIHENQVICEPARKNTAPCIAYAAYKIHSLNPNAAMVVAPSDHIILKEDIFCSIISDALDEAGKSDNFYTLGIKPSRPDTGYGYIQYVAGQLFENSELLRKVKTFTEKPNEELAKSFLQSGDFLWNSGIFIWSSKSIINAFERYQPEISDVFQKAIPVYNTPQEEPYIDKAYPSCKSISIDYAIMEKAENVHVFISDFGWSDLGTWGSLFESMDKDENNNAVMGNNVLLYETENCIVNVPSNKLVVMQGLNDYIVSEYENSLLICHKSQEQQIRKFVNDVKITRGEEFV
jgi:mannose-1-phosphate guanylyltransferase